MRVAGLAPCGYHGAMTELHIVTDRTARSFVEMALGNPYNGAILERLDALEAPDCWLVAGCLYQTVWNLMSGRPAAENIKDYDVFYHDASDLGYGAEDVVIRRGADLFADLDVEVEIRNQARVHLWYEARFGHPRAPLTNALHGISSYLVTGTCLGIRADGQGGHDVAAPYGLDDMFDGVLKANKAFARRDLFEAKAASYTARWPWLKTVGWDDDA